VNIGLMIKESTVGTNLTIINLYRALVTLKGKEPVEIEWSGSEVLPFNFCG